MITRATSLFLHAAALALAAQLAACGSSDTGTGGSAGGGPCSGDGADKLAPLECHLGACNVLVAACQGGEPATCPPASPQAEACHDGLDNDCNGQIDDGCACTDGDQQPCYSGAAATRNVGVCHDGAQTCVKGVWGECKGDARPQKETCDTLDNNCDGVIDEVCPCTDGDQQPCYGGPPETAGVGVCVTGMESCAGGAWGQCTGAVLPQPEVCDGVDNDCDGAVDDGDVGQGVACEVPGGVGACKDGMTACAGGALSCMSLVKPAAEVCDGLDNNCDGVIDNGNFCCKDGKKGGPESDVDCGADCDVQCDAGQACHTPEDCKSGVCTNAVCGP